jgi:hypothetical protein
VTTTGESNRSIPWRRERLPADRLLTDSELSRHRGERRTPRPSRPSGRRPGDHHMGEGAVYPVEGAARGPHAPLPGSDTRPTRGGDHPWGEEEAVVLRGPAGDGAVQGRAGSSR